MPESASGKSAVTLEELTALNDEIASLVRVGVPLEMGLAGFGTDIGRKLDRLNERLVERLQNGASLNEAVAAEPTLPPVYRAVVEAGLETGRLADTLESLTGFAKSLHELRRQIGLALVYPLVVLCFGYVLFLAFLIGMVPQLAEIHRSFQVPQSKWFAMLIFLHETSAFWGPVFPVLILVYTVCWRTSAGSILSVGRSPSRVQRLIAAWVFGWVPWVRLFLSNFHRANFADLLAILVKQGTPLPRAMRLAGEANGHMRIVQDCRTLADDLSDGVSLQTALQGTTAFSPFMKWMMGIGEQQGTLIGALEQIGVIYRRRASQQAEWCFRVLPFMLLFYVGGGATLLYGLTLFLPLAELIERLSLD